jgi:hypothetical protein
MIKKIGNRWFVVHHKKKGMIGKPIGKKGFSTYQGALRQHRAIILSKLRRGERI